MNEFSLISLATQQTGVKFINIYSLHVESKWVRKIPRRRSEDNIKVYLKIIFKMLIEITQERASLTS